MGILDNFRKAFGPKPMEKKYGAGPVMGYFGVGPYSDRKMGYADLATDGYLKNSIVFRCVNEISKGASAVPYRIKQGDEIIQESQLNYLLNRPNPLQSYSEFFNSLFSFMLLGGNAYILRVTNNNEQPKELHLLRPDRIEIKGSNKVFPDKFVYRVGGNVINEYEIDQDTGKGDVKQIKLWNPLDDYYGLSPLVAAAMEVDQHNAATRHNIGLLENGARPSGAVVFKPQDDGGYPIQLTDAQRQQLLEDLNNRFSGSQNAGRPMLLEGDFDWKEMGLSPKDMDFLNLKHMSATDIAMCFGVPSQLVGVPDAQTYSNMAEARLALYEETIIPYLRKVESDLNEWLIPQFEQMGESLSFEYDIDRIPALAERRRMIYENVLGAVNAGVMTRNEARELVGLSPMDGADDLLVPSNLFPLNEGAPPEPEVVDDPDDIAMFGDDEEKQEDITNFPKAGDNKKISLRNSNFPQFDFDFAQVMANDMTANGRKIWKAGGNIRGTEAFRLWEKAKKGEETPAVLSWIKEREAWSARHTVIDGNAFKDPKLEPNLSNVGGIVSLIKWGAINPDIGERRMKDIILELTKKLEDRKTDNIIRPQSDEHEIESLIDDVHVKAPEDTRISEQAKRTLQGKVDEHNEEFGDTPSKRATLRMLEAVFRRGVGAYYTNPQSVRPNVSGPDQWAFARVNAFLFALRTGRFQGGKFDRDLLPKGHPLSTKE